jgi:hypothetical protein
MAVDQETLGAQDDLASLWGEPTSTVVCSLCDWSYMLPQGVLPQRCPNCFRGELTPVAVGADGQLPHVRPPELYLPFSIPIEKVLQNIQQFAGGPWFAPTDLTSQNLRGRLKRVYWPMWLVDCDVQATWEAEAGYNYEVVSHQDRYNETQAGWTSQEVKETRVRWEPRAGRLTRSYANVPAPALEDHRQLMAKVRGFQLEQAQPYSSEALKQAFVRLPNRSSVDAWPDAVPAVQSASADECRQAARADHIRQFQWSPEYRNQHWTPLLLPVYTTYYLDDDAAPQPVFIHGQSGYLSGKRRASMKRAQRTALMILVAAAITLVLGLLFSAAGLFIPPLLVLGGIGILAAILVGVAAVIPVVMAWQINRST